MKHVAVRGPRGLLVFLAPALALLGCPGESHDPNAPVIQATAVGFTDRAAAAGLHGGVLVRVLDPGSGQPLTTAVVDVAGYRPPYDPNLGGHAAAVPVPPGTEVAVSVSVGNATYRATGRIDAFPALTGPAGTWSALAPHALTWRRGAPSAAAHVLGVVDGADPNGRLVWPPGGAFHTLAGADTTFTFPPGSLTGGERVLLVGLLASTPFAGADPRSSLAVAGFDAGAVTVTVGTTVASSPAPANLIASGGVLLWSDVDAPVKSVPSGGGPVARLVERRAMPESVTVAGSALYWIAGDELLRSALDGSATTVLARGPRDTGPNATTPVVLVDGTAAYWVNTVPDPACGSACRWAIVRVPLDGGPAATLATAPAPIAGLAADGTTVYWVQQGNGPVSADGNDPRDSAVRAVPKAGGPAVTLVNGLLNGPPRVLPPGQLAANWFARGGLVVTGGQVVFATTGFFDGYSVLQVPVGGGPVGELQRVFGSGSSFVRAMATDGTDLFWIDDQSVRSVPLAGGTAVQLATGIYQPTGVAVASGTVTWSETVCCLVSQNGRVRSVPSGGGPALTLADLLDNPAGVAADPAAAYWVEGGPYGALEGYGRIARVPSGGGGVATVVAAEFAERPDFAADGVRVVLADGWRAKAAPLAGGPLDVVVRAGVPVSAVATDGAFAYALDAQGDLLRAPLTTAGPVAVLAAGSLAPIASGAQGPLRLGGGHAYWVDHGSTLRRVPLAGGAAETLASGLQGVSDVVVGDGFVYVAPSLGPIVAVPVAGGAPSSVGAGTAHAGARLALDARNLYWIDEGALGRIALAGGAEQVLAIGLSARPGVGNFVAVDANGLYWIESGPGLVKRSDDR